MIYIWFALLFTFTARAGEPEIVVSAVIPDEPRSARFKQLFDAAVNCRIEKEDQCRSQYQKFNDYLQTKTVYHHLNTDEVPRMRVWENGAIQRLHQMDLDYNAVYIKGDAYSAIYDETLSNNEPSRPGLTPRSDNGVYAREEVEARNALVGQTAASSSEAASLCHIPIDAGGVSFIGKKFGEGETSGFVEDAIALKKIDWLAVDSVPQSMQPVVDTFLNSREDSREFKDARAQLYRFFGVGQDGTRKTQWYGKKPSPTFSLIDLARKNKVKVRVIGPDPSYATRGPVTEPLIGATRNLVESSALPTEGNGVVLTSYRQTEAPAKARLQDFYARQNRSVHVTSRSTVDRACELTSEQTQSCQSDVIRFAESCGDKTAFRCLRLKAAFLSTGCARAVAPSGPTPSRPTTRGTR